MISVPLEQDYAVIEISTSSHLFVNLLQTFFQCCDVIVVVNNIVWDLLGKGTGYIDKILELF